VSNSSLQQQQQQQCCSYETSTTCKIDQPSVGHRLFWVLFYALGRCSPKGLNKRARHSKNCALHLDTRKKGEFVILHHLFEILGICFDAIMVEFLFNLFKMTALEKCFFTNLHILIPFGQLAFTFCQVLSFVAANCYSFGCLESVCMCCMRFLQVWVYAKSCFCYLGTYPSGISYAVNGLAWGGFA
jgi:hypothetical protein